MVTSSFWIIAPNLKKIIHFSTTFFQLIKKSEGNYYYWLYKLYTGRKRRLSVTPRNLTFEIFIRYDSRILMSNAFFWLVIIMYEVLLTFIERLLVLSQLSTHTSSLFTAVWTLLMSLSNPKTVVSSAKWTNA